jgi:sugar phosphate isomerase/epimerase
MFTNLAPGAIGMKMALPETLVVAKRIGWQGVDLPVAEAVRYENAHGTGSVATLFNKSGVQVGGWGLPLNWRVSYELEALHELDAQAALAASVGATRCYTWVPPGSSERPFRENFDFHVRQLRPVARILEEHGCQLGLEFVGPYTSRAPHRYGFIYTIEGMLSLAAATSTNVGLLVDAWHWYTGLGALADIRALQAKDVVYVHINDAPAGIAIDAQQDLVRRLPGATGVIDLQGFLSTLKEIGYAGPVTPEPFDAELAAKPDEEACAETYQHLMQVWLA